VGLALQKLHNYLKQAVKQQQQSLADLASTTDKMQASALEQLMAQAGGLLKTWKRTAKEAMARRERKKVACTKRKTGPTIRMQY
jgi:hypothetical protein